MEKTAEITYRKTKSGEWVAFGPADAIRADCDILVSKKDGSHKDEYVERVGKVFTVGGVEMRYGYLAKRSESSSSLRSRGRRLCVTGGNCSSFGSGRNCGGEDCDGY